MSADAHEQPPLTVDDCLFAVIDIEAVTPRGRTPLPIEIACVLVSGALEEDAEVLFDELIALNDITLLTKFDTEQTGITASALGNARVAREVLSDLDKRIPRDALLVAHHAAFERSVLAAQPTAPQRLRSAPILDTVRLAQHFAIALPAHRHRAAPDALLACALLRKLLAIARDDGMLRSRDELISAMTASASRARRETLQTRLL